VHHETDDDQPEEDADATVTKEQVQEESEGKRVSDVTEKMV